MSEFTTRIRWTGDRGDGTQTYRSYDRTWNIEPSDKTSVECSNDPAIGGDPTKYNPEELLLAGLAGCHMLWYLHLASNAKIIVRGYEDDPLGIGVTGKAGEGRFELAILRPVITVERGTDLEKADALHEKIHRYCFIARSVSFSVSYEARYVES
jgi:organic hydroperoxide reductase OsmC/OhrA